jgi:hypothetical protein
MLPKEEISIENGQTGKIQLKKKRLKKSILFQLHYTGTVVRMYRIIE